MESKTPRTSRVVHGLLVGFAGAAAMAALPLIPEVRQDLGPRP